MNENDPRITAYVLGELDDNERADVERALESSPELRQAVEEVRETVGLLGASLEAEPCPELTSAQRERIADEAKEPAVTVPVPMWRERRGLVAAVAVVAALAVTVIVGLNYPTGESESERATAHRDARELLSRSVEERLSSEWVLDESASASRGADDMLDSDASIVANSEPTDRPEESVAGTFESKVAPRPATPAIIDGAPQTSPYSNFVRDSWKDAAKNDQSGGQASFGGRQGQGRNDAMSGEVDRGGATLTGPATNGVIAGAPEDRLRVTDEESRRENFSAAESKDGQNGRGVNAVRLESNPQLRERLRELRDNDGDSNADGAVDDAGVTILGGVRVQWKEDDGTVVLRGSRRDVDRVRRLLSGKADVDGKQKPNAAKKQVWTRARATPNAARISIGDEADLPIKGMQASVMIDGFRARVILDLYFFNDRNQRLEGNFKLRLPDDASPYYFAFGESAYEYRPAVDKLASKGFLSGELIRAAGSRPAEILRSRAESWRSVKEARFVPREKAAHAYGETVRRRVDPALVEWAGAGVFNARVFPLAPQRLHRVVVGYDVNLTRVADDLTYSFELPRGLPECMIDLDLSAQPGGVAEVTPKRRPFVSGGRAFYHFEDPTLPHVKVEVKKPGPVLLYGEDAETGKFFATRFAPQLPDAEANASSPNAIFLMDTSLSSNPDKFNVWLKLLESTLQENRDAIKNFAVLFFNVEAHWWQPKFVANTAENVRKVLNDASALSLEGATDLHLALREATSPSTWDKGIQYERPDLFLLSDGAATWGEFNLHMLGEVLQSGTGGTLFAYKTGLLGTSTQTLEHLARESGGAVFSIATEDEVAAAAKAHRRRPWQLLETKVNGGEDLLVAGRPNSIYPDQVLLLVGRGQPQGEITLKLRRGDKVKTVSVSVTQQLKSELAARIYGQVAVGQLEHLQQATEKISAAYARHFRVTGRTCALLMLESEADYQRFNIRPKDDVTLVSSSRVDTVIARKLDEFATALRDPKQQTLDWLARLERMPGLQFQMPPALELALEQLPSKSFQVDVPRLVCQQRNRADLSKKYFAQLSSAKLDYRRLMTEAERRKQTSAADALRAVSSLVEKNPGDFVLLRDVAFSAMHWDLAGQAFPLLRRVVEARPYEPPTYLAIARCLADVDRADLAIVYYEVALASRWNQRYHDIHDIARTEYVQLLTHIAKGELKSQMKDYAVARQRSVVAQAPFSEADLVVTLEWNTDRTDVDLHVREPSGEECYYKNRNTRTGGRVTKDVTEGYGPEMYVIRKAPAGKYKIMVNYYGTDANRMGARTRVFVRVVKGFGGKSESVIERAVLLSETKEKRHVVTVDVNEK